MHNNINSQTQFPLAVLKPQKKPHHYNLSEYLRREEKSDRLHEYYNGIIKKLQEYKTLDSFHEYVLIDQKRCYIKTHFKEEQNLWCDSFFTDPNGSLFLKSVNCEIPMSAIYKNIAFKK